MKIAILSNIFANSIALNAVLEDICKDDRIKKIINCGNFLPNGPSPAEVAELIIEGNVMGREIISVLGPLDVNILKRAHPALNLKGYFTVEDWALGQIGVMKQKKLLKLKEYILLDLDGKKISISYRLLYNKFNEPDVIVIGEPKNAFKNILAKKVIIAPGILGFSQNFIAIYGVLDLKTFDFEERSVNYDRNELINQYNEKNMPNKEKIMEIYFGI
ncbi:MAG: hypothetical protein ACTSRZ_14555 [Promethearchaeota archaeon]